jgi:hypothetical protein
VPVSSPAPASLPAPVSSPSPVIHPIPASVPALASGSIDETASVSIQDPTPVTNCQDPTVSFIPTPEPF